MIDLKFTEEDRKILNHERFYHPHPRVQLKMEAMWLKSQNLPMKLICTLADISPNTLRKYSEEYQSGGLEQLKKINFNRPKSELEAHEITIREYLELNPPANINQAAQQIEHLTGIKRSPSQIRKFLKSIGMRCLKVGAIPSKADPDAQEEYKRDKLEPRLEEAKRGERAVFFVDAAHFVMGAFLGMIWCFQRIFIKSPSGRKRFNVLGALNAITHEVILVTNDSYITGTQVCELLQKIANLGMSIPITLVLDNARYQKCRIVQDLAKSLEIELLYLPTYSPNLNLIERLWKFADEIAPRFPRRAFHQAVKKNCLYGKYYEDFGQFSSAISGCLNDAHLNHAKELSSLLTLRFQHFDKAQIMTV